MRKIHVLLIALALIALLLLALSGPLYANNILELGAAFTLLRWAAYLGAAAFVANIVAYFICRPQGAIAVLTGLAVLASAVAFYMPYAQMRVAKSVPPIHDISTDTNNPPEFVAIAPLRADAPNPVAYAGKETAQQQLAAYPDITTFSTMMPKARLFAAARASAERLGWEVVASNEAEGRIEATDTTRWFGFKDDVVIRIRTTANGSAIDVRSKSRVGRSDVGKNAQRIRSFFAELDKQLNK